MNHVLIRMLLEQFTADWMFAAFGLGMHRCMLWLLRGIVGSTRINLYYNHVILLQTEPTIPFVLDSRALQDMLIWLRDLIALTFGRVQKGTDFCVFLFMTNQWPLGELHWISTEMDYKYLRHFYIVIMMRMFFSEFNQHNFSDT